MKTLIKLVSSMSLVAAVSFSASAAPISVDADNFGNITMFDGGAVTFGGTGIPTNATNFSDFEDGNGNTLRIGLSATPRFSASLPTNDGAGTFFVAPGLSGDARSLWNFSFFAEINGQLNIGDINLQLLYDLDPNIGTDIDDLGIISLSLYPQPVNTIAQGSQNSTFAYLSTGFIGVAPPSVTAFDANMGEYSFLLRAEGFGDVGINVNVNSVSAPTAGILMSLMIGGMLVSRKFTR